MRAPRRRRGEEHEGEEVNVERWTTSYMDMVTVMMCLFIVLFAISQVDQQKFFALRDSLAVSFGEPSSTDTKLLDGGEGVLAADAVVPDTVDVTQESGGPVHGAQDTGTLAAAKQEVTEFTELQHQLEAALASYDVAGDVTFSITDRGLVIGLVSADVFFTAESAQLTDTSVRVVDAVGPVLGATPYALSVEGHANVLPTSRYPTNWELSSDRATQVLRRMVEHGTVPAGRIQAVGFGDAHPVQAEGQDPLTVNRRVDIVVLSDAPEAVRALMPDVVAGNG
jgi:chemotaxis protein MotB